MLSGSFEDALGRYEAHSWMRLPAQFIHRPVAAQRCELYVKEGGFGYLRSGVARNPPEGGGHSPD